MGLAQQIKSGSVEFVSAAGPSLLESLWKELLKEWGTLIEPFVDEEEFLEDSTKAIDFGYCVGIAYAIAKIEKPYSDSEEEIKRVLADLRERVKPL